MDHYVETETMSAYVVGSKIGKTFASIIGLVEDALDTQELGDSQGSGPSTAVAAELVQAGAVPAMEISNGHCSKEVPSRQVYESTASF